MAYQHGDKATALLGESEQKVMQGKNKSFKKAERNVYLKEAKEIKREAHRELVIAGKLFEEIEMFNHSA